MSDHQAIHLGVNVDHIATLRQVRGTTYPDPQQAAEIARLAGADGITVHLREDRRHIQDFDAFNINASVALPLNFEMAATEQMLEIALELEPHECCLVPEKREELTTEGGLDAAGLSSDLELKIARLQDKGILVSLFIDPDEEQIRACHALGVNIVELHTGTYAENDGEQQRLELARLQQGAELTAELGMQVNAGHGLHYQNVQQIAAIPCISCLNIGHAIVARAAMSGMYEAVFMMKQILNGARLESEGEGY